MLLYRVGTACLLWYCGCVICHDKHALVTLQENAVHIRVRQHLDSLSCLVQIPYVMVRGNSDYLYKPIEKFTNGTWGCA